MNDQPAAVAEKLPPLWNLNYIRVGIVSLVGQTGFMMLFSCFTLYLGNKGFSSTNIGLIASGSTICAMIMRFLGGNLVDNIGRRVIGLTGLVLFTVPLLGYRFLPIPIIIVLCRLLQGMGTSATTVCTGTMAADVLHPSRLAEGISYYGLFSSAASAVGPAVGLALYNSAAGETGMFTAVAIMMALCITLMFTMNYEKKTPMGKRAKAKAQAAAGITPAQAAQAAPAAEEPAGFLWRFLEKGALPAALIMGVMSVGSAAVGVFAAPYALSLGLPGVGLLFTVQAICMFVMRLLSSRVTKVVGTLNTMLIGLTFMALGVGGLIFVKNYAMLLISGGIMGCGSGFCGPILNVLAVAKAPASRRGKATSTFYAAFDIGSGIGSFLWGFVVDAAGYRAIFIGAAAIMTLNILLGFLMFRRSLSRKAENAAA